jgi:hypothetical protein
MNMNEKQEFLFYLGVSQNFARKYTIPIVDGQTDVP